MKVDAPKVKEEESDIELLPRDVSEIRSAVSLLYVKLERAVHGKLGMPRHCCMVVSILLIPLG